MDNFNVIEFENIINNIIDRTVAAENFMHKISSVMTELINCIGNQESKELYEGWDSVLSTTIEICNKFSSRKIEFINELKSYRDSTIKLN